MNTYRMAVVVCAGLAWCSVAPGDISTSGSVWDEGPGGDLYVAYDADGTLTIDAGSGLSRDDSYVGYCAGCTGMAMVSGGGSTWDSIALFIGEEGTGTVNVVAGGEVTGRGYLGNSPGSTGTLMVSGTGSMWDGQVTVGHEGSGTLSILAGGQVMGSCFVARERGSTGAVTVSGVGSTWTGGAFHLGVRGSGTLDILDGGQASGGTAYLCYSEDTEFTATVSGIGSIWTNSALTVGWYGNGTLNILAGGYVDSGGSNLAGYRNATGTVTVSGAGSTWAVGGSLDVGDYGSGTLNILDGGHVSSMVAYVAHYLPSAGAATVSGPGSTWTISGPLYVGTMAKGTVTVSDGGQVTADQLTLWDSRSILSLHVSGDDMLVLGNAGTVGSVTNNGTISFYADPFLPAGIYRPISEFAGRTMAWSGPGAYEAFGGTWNAGAKTFEVSAATLLDAGAVEDVTSGERLLFTDPGSGDSVGASFGAVPGGTTFSADLLSPVELADLAGLLEPGEQVLAGWDFTSNLTGRDVLLSMDIGTGMTDLAFWHLDGGGWSSYSPDSFTHDAGGDVSFTASEFSGYAVTGVPEPASLTLLALGGLMLARRRRPGRPSGRTT